MIPELGANDIKMFYRYLDKATVYFEYGSGGSTYQVSLRPNIQKIYTVESDKTWMNKLNSIIKNNTKITYIYNEMGTKPHTWGYPSRRCLKSNLINYSEHIRNLGIEERSKIDLVMIDAPCSGSGLFRKDISAISEWSLDNVQHCSLRQQRIIEESLDTLKEGGYLIYSTCSYSFEEDEKIMDQIANLPGMVNVKITVPPSWNIISCESPEHQCQGFRFYPDKIKGEGFFISVFKKEGAAQNTSTSDSFKFTPLSKNELSVAKSFFELPATHQYLSHQNSMIAIPNLFEPAILSILSNLYVKKLGLDLGAVKGKDFIPSHALAMSYWSNLPYQTLEVGSETALNYLRRAEVQLDGNVGWHLIKYQSIALGWAKLLPNRANNYYPNEWRILNY